MDIIETLRDCSRESARESAWHGGASEAYHYAAELVQQHAAGTDRPPAATPTPALPALPPPTPRNARSAEIMSPVFDLLRERGTWMTEPEIVDALTKAGVAATSQTVWRVLTSGVRAGHLERRGDSFRTGTLKK